MTTRSFITGSGDPDKLRLIEESFAMLCDSPTLPNLRMLYKSSSDMLSEGFIWGVKIHGKRLVCFAQELNCIILCAFFRRVYRVILGITAA